MNFTSKKLWAVTAATAILSTAALSVSQPAEAFIVKATLNGTAPVSTPNPSLAAPTKIDFSNVSNNTLVSTTATKLTSSASNGDAYIQSTSGTSVYRNNTDLNVGRLIGPVVTGSVDFTFFQNGSTTTTQNIGYFGFQWLGTNDTSTITFTSTTNAVQSFTRTTLNSLLSGSQQIAAGSNYFIEFFVSNPNEIIQKVALADSSRTSFFEVDNVNYQAIPTPALLPGIAAVGLGILRKRKSEPAEAKA